MKIIRLISFLFILFFPLVTFFSCNETAVQPGDQDGKVKFQFGSNESVLSKVSEDTIAKQIFITLSDQSGKEVLKLQKVDLVLFGSGYVSLPVALPEGDYTLTEFFVTNSQNETIFACPVSGSEKSHLVSHPLPLPVKITSDTEATLNIEVLQVSIGDHPSLFGYISFTMNLIKTLDVLIAPMTMNPASGTFELVSSDLTVLVNNTMYLEMQLGAKTNRVSLNELNPADVISFKVSHETLGEKTVDHTFGYLKDHAGTPLIIILDGKGEQTSRLLAWYPLDGNATDASGHQLDGLISGATLSADRFGNQEKSYYFDGNSKIDLGDILNDQGFPFSVALWVKPETEQMIGRVFHTDFGIGQDAYYGFGVFSRDGSFDISTGDGNGLGYETRFGVMTNNKYPVQNWYHVTAIFSSSFNYKIYINGSLAQSWGDGSSPGIAHNSDHAVIGALFHGSIDDVRIYGKTLSATEVFEIYSGSEQ